MRRPAVSRCLCLAGLILLGLAGAPAPEAAPPTAAATVSRQTTARPKPRPAAPARTAQPPAVPIGSGDGSPLAQALAVRVGGAGRGIPQLGVNVVEVETGKEIYGFRPDEMRTLASNTKLFTTAAAVDLLGTEFEFETPLVMRGQVEGDTLAGDLAVVGSGDPNISGRFYEGDVYAVFRAWAGALRDRGIARVAGDLYLVDGLFERHVIHPSWPRDQLMSWYEAPVAALSFSDNCILVRVRPGGKPGAPGRVELVPNVDLYRVISQVTTTGSPRQQHLAVYRGDDGRSLVVQGAVWAGAPFESWVTVPEPVEYFGAALRALLAEVGITVEGNVRTVEQLPGAVWEQVATHKSDLLTTLTVINHRSQNFYAESVFKLLGARVAGEGSWPGGVRAVTSFLERAGIKDGFELSDGSGMSRGNRATPRRMTALLRHMFLHPSADLFLRSLPVSGGTDTNWRRRLAEAPYGGNVFAKTGTLSDVSTLSGYARGRSGRFYAFSILCNGTPAVSRSRAAQDAIVRAIIDNG